MNFGLTDTVAEQIQAVFRKHPEVEQVRIFGSRAMGNFQDNSDVDLAFWGEISDQQLAAIHAELDELPTPYQFDVKIYSDIIHQPLTEHIDAHGVVVYQSRGLSDSSKPR